MSHESCDDCDDNSDNERKRSSHDARQKRAIRTFEITSATHMRAVNGAAECAGR